MKVICENHEKCLVGQCKHKIPHDKDYVDYECNSSCFGYTCTTKLLIKKYRKQKLEQLKNTDENRR